jgi:hypothetical protein
MFHRSSNWSLSMRSVRRYVLDSDCSYGCQADNLADFDLCEACEKANLGVNDVHKADHDLLKIHWELPKFPDGKTVTEISWSLETARDPTSFADVDHSSPGPIAAAAESIPACPVGGVPSTETKVVDSPAEHTEKDSEHQEKPPQGRRLYCHGGCGRTDLSVIHVCLECPEGAFLLFFAYSL